MRASFVKVSPGRAYPRDLRPQDHLGQAIRDLREQAGLTQGQLGERAELQPTWISHIEAGRSNVHWGNLRRIAVGLQVELEDLLSLTREFEMRQAVGLAVRRIREEQEFAQSTVAERARISTEELAEIERGTGPRVSDQVEGRLRRGLRVRKKRWYGALLSAKDQLGIS